MTSLPKAAASPYASSQSYHPLTIFPSTSKEEIVYISDNGSTLKRPGLNGEGDRYMSLKGK